MTDLTRCKEFLRSFNGAYDDWADEIERMRPLVEAAKHHFMYNQLVGKSFCICDICKSYREYEAKR